MAVIVDYDTLQTAVADYLARDDLSSYIPNFIQNCESKLYRSLNLRAEETALSVSVSSGVGAVPTRFKALKYAYVNESPITLLEWMPVEDLFRQYPVRSGAETPKFISRSGSNFVFGPYPKDFTLSGVYYQKLEPIRTTDSTWYVVNAPDVMLYGSLLEATPFIKHDPRLPVWQQFYDNGIGTLLLEERNSEKSKGSLAARIEGFNAP